MYQRSRKSILADNRRKAQRQLWDHRRACPRCSAAARARRPAGDCDTGWQLARQLADAEKFLRDAIESDQRRARSQLRFPGL